MANNLSTERRSELCRLLGINLSTLREKANITQSDLADRIGIKRQTISAIETGKRNMSWSTFSLLTLFFAKHEEINKIMAAMGVINAEVEQEFML
jgi:DNA-binding XRE family transcriptional regulator